MCGIAGIIDHASAETLLPAAQKMVAALRHRGPDSCGVISSAGCLLANTRLAILDLSERGASRCPILAGPCGSPTTEKPTTQANCAEI